MSALAAAGLFIIAFVTGASGAASAFIAWSAIQDARISGGVCAIDLAVALAAAAAAASCFTVMLLAAEALS